MGIAYLGIGIGGALVPLAAHALTQALGWRGALRSLGVLMIVIALPGGPLRTRAASALRGASPATPEAASMAGVLRRPAFYLLALGSMASIGAVGGTMQNLKLYLSLDRGLTQGRVATLLSLILVGSIVGRLLMGWLGRPLAQEARDAPHLRHRGRDHPPPGLGPFGAPALRGAPSSSASASAATT